MEVTGAVNKNSFFPVLSEETNVSVDENEIGIADPGEGSSGESTINDSSINDSSINDTSVEVPGESSDEFVTDDISSQEDLDNSSNDPTFRTRAVVNNVPRPTTRNMSSTI